MAHWTCIVPRWEFVCLPRRINENFFGGIKPKDMNMDDKFELTLENAQPVLVVPIKVTNHRELSSVDKDNA
ncbi:hypothetical protein MTR_1g037380 [Medicago truncatula]|uniref:Uncharacterized protein n=1 Tax=Medicago truncatula TaxID=3880 RepID=A0A072VFY4_MEDTR|nr:hypothetical protein MTR_1g037380 [Medicago truncatula]